MNEPSTEATPRWMAQLNPEQQALVQAMYAYLDGRQERVLKFRYGWMGRKPLTQKQTGAEMGYSASRIGQIERGALRKLYHLAGITKKQLIAACAYDQLAFPEALETHESSKAIVGISFGQMGCP